MPSYGRDNFEELNDYDAVNLEGSQIVANKNIHILLSKQYIRNQVYLFPIFTNKIQLEDIICNLFYLPNILHQ